MLVLVSILLHVAHVACACDDPILDVSGEQMALMLNLLLEGIERAWNLKLRSFLSFLGFSFMYRNDQLRICIKYIFKDLYVIKVSSYFSR